MSLQRRTCLGFIVMLLLPLSIQAQQAERVPEQVFLNGLEAFEAGRYSGAITQFNRVVESDSTYHDADHGSAIYWLGQSVGAAGDTGTALQIWRQGLGAFDAAGKFDVRLADVYLRAAFADEAGDEALGAALYFDLLLHADSSLKEPEREIVERHLAQLEFILPEEWHSRVFTEGTDTRRGRISLQPGAGEAAFAWWQREDPEPTTDDNPRLIEHLRRVAEAEERFYNRRDGAGFDDRGRIFVRFGEPSYTREIRSYELDSFVHPAIQSIPPNEYWVYVHVSSEAKYLFAQKRGAYRIGGVLDLLPSALRTFKTSRTFEDDFSSVQRRVTVGTALPILEDFYGQLVTHNVDYAGIYNSISVPAGTHPISIMHEASYTDRQVTRTREANVPREYSEAAPEAAPLPLKTRVARFLEADGTTRTEVYWAPEPGALDPTTGVTNSQVAHAAERSYLLEAALVEFDPDYRRESATPRYLDAGPAETAPGSTIPAQTLMAERTDELFHLALDVRQYFAETPEETRPELLLKRGATRIDSVRALSADRSQLEMSDLRPMLLPDLEAEAQLAQMPPDEMRRLAYPFQKLPAGAPLALYFELYHLSFGADDRARYTIEYEIRRRTEQGWLRTLFQGQDEQQTTTTLDREGSSRRAEELIVLDLSELETDEGALQVTVRITDEVTGAQQERVLHFELFEPEE